MLYELSSMLLISFSHIYLFSLSMHDQKHKLWHIILLSLLINVVLIVALALTGYTELNVIVLLIFLTIIGIKRQSRPIQHIVFFAFFSMIVVTAVKNVLFQSLHELYFVTPFNYYLYTDSMLGFVAMVLITLALISGQRIIVKFSNYIVESKWLVPAFILLVIFTILLLIVNVPTWQLLAELNAQYGEVLYTTVLTGVVVFLLLLTFSMYRSKKRLIKRHEQERQQQLLEYVEKLEFLHDELATFRHDYGNLLLSLDTSIRANDIEQVRRIYEQTIAPTADILNNQQLELTKLARIHLPELKSLLSMKILTAQRRHLHVQLDIPQPIQSISLPMEDLLRMTSVLIDNAIEAAAQTAEKRLQMALFETNDCFYCIVQNSSAYGQVFLPQLFEKQASTKGEGRGYGLFSLKRILQRYPHATLATEQHEQVFKQQLVVRQLKTEYEQFSTV